MQLLSMMTYPLPWIRHTYRLGCLIAVQVSHIQKRTLNLQHTLSNSQRHFFISVNCKAMPSCSDQKLQSHPSIHSLIHLLHLIHQQFLSDLPSKCSLKSITSHYLYQHPLIVFNSMHFSTYQLCVFESVSNTL